jgi:hypothetical protein
MRPPERAMGVWRPAQCTDDELGRWVQASLTRAYGQAEASQDSWPEIRNRIRLSQAAEDGEKASVRILSGASVVQAVLVAVLMLTVGWRWLGLCAWQAPMPTVMTTTAAASEPLFEATSGDILRSIDLLRVQWRMSPTERLAARDVSVANWNCGGVVADRRDTLRWRDIGDTFAET